MKLTRFLDWLTRLVLGPKRLDHEPLYSCTIAGIILATFLSIVLPRSTSSAISNLSITTQASLVLCLFAGACVCLYGIAMGTVFDPVRQAGKWVHRWLGKPQPPIVDRRRYYRVGGCGTPAVFISLAYYCENVLAYSPTNPVNVTGAALIAFTGLGMFFQWLRFLMEIRRISHTVPKLIEQEINRRIIEYGLDDD